MKKLIAVMLVTLIAGSAWADTTVATKVKGKKGKKLVETHAALVSKNVEAKIKKA